MRTFVILMLSVVGMALVDAACVNDTRCPLLDDGVSQLHLAHALECGKFYTCSYGQACEKSCPNGQHFSSTLQRCEWPSVACCDSTVPCNPNSNPSNPAEPSTTTVASSDAISACPVDSRCPMDDNPNNPKHLAHESDCSRFYTCTYGRRCLKQCRAGEHFSEQLQRCEFPAIACCDASVSCQQGSTVTTTTATPTVALPTVAPTVSCIPDARCPLVELDQFAPLLLSVPGNCESFYKCRNGDACLIPCPPGQHFSEKLQMCEWPEVACCSSSVSC